MSIKLAVWIGIVVPLIVSTGALIGTRLKGNFSLEEHLVCSKNVTRPHFVFTLTASNAALANILFLFAYWGFTFGAWAFMWSSLFWGVGFLLFSWFARRPFFTVVTEPDRPELGLNEILGRAFSSKAVLIASGVVSALAFLFLLSLELNVGSKLFAVFVAEPSPTAPYAFALGFGFFLAVYAGLGGFPLVVRTDVVQLLFLILALITVLFSLNIMLKPDETFWSLFGASLRDNPWFEFSWSHLPFVVGSLFSWGIWFLCTMDMWQRTLAVRAPKKNIGLWGLLPGYGLLVFVTWVGVLIGIFVRHAVDLEFSKFPLITFIELITTAAGSDFRLVVALGVILAGFVAALLSTVDTYLIVVAHSLAGDIGEVRRGWLGDIAASDSRYSERIRKRVQLSTALLPLFAVVLFWFSEHVAAQDTFTLYMLAGSIPMALVPACLALFFSSASVAEPSTRLKRISVAVSAFMVIAAISGMIANFFLANRALATFDPRYFGLLYLIPAGVALIACLPFLFVLRRPSG